MAMIRSKSCEEEEEAGTFHIVKGVSPVHTDLIRPERRPKLKTEKTIESMTVVSISLKYVSTAHLAVKKNLT